MSKKHRKRLDAGSQASGFTAKFKKVPEGYIAFTEDLPGAYTQGKTLKEARENFKEAVELILEANRYFSKELVKNSGMFREQFKIDPTV